MTALPTDLHTVEQVVVDDELDVTNVAVTECPSDLLIIVETNRPKKTRQPSGTASVIRRQPPKEERVPGHEMADSLRRLLLIDLGSVPAGARIAP